MADEKLRDYLIEVMGDSDSLAATEGWQPNRETDADAILGVLQAAQEWQPADVEGQFSDWIATFSTALAALAEYPGRPLRHRWVLRSPWRRVKQTVDWQDAGPA